MLKSFVTEWLDWPDKGSTGETSNVDIDRESLARRVLPSSQFVPFDYKQKPRRSVVRRAGGVPSWRARIVRSEVATNNGATTGEAGARRLWPGNLELPPGQDGL